MCGTRDGEQEGGPGMTATAAARPAKHKTTGFGLFEGLLPIDRARLPLDMIAGATLAALAIPEVMGYSNIAGTPVITGLYTLLLPIVAFAIFGLVPAPRRRRRLRDGRDPGVRSRREGARRDRPSTSVGRRWPR